MHLLDADAWLHAADRAQPMRASYQLALRSEHPIGSSDRALECHRRPHINRCRPRESGWPEHRPVREREVLRHHADHCGADVRELHGAPDHVGVATEPPLPEAVAQEQLERVVVTLKGSSDERTSAEQIEQTRRHRDPDDDLARSVGYHLKRRHKREIALETIECSVHLLEVSKVCRRQRVARPILFDGVTPHVDESIAVGVGKRLHQHAVDDGENGAVGPDAERQCQDRERSDERRFARQPQGMLHVGSQRVPEHVMSPGWCVQMRSVVGPEDGSGDRGAAFRETTKY